MTRSRESGLCNCRRFQKVACRVRDKCALTEKSNKLFSNKTHRLCYFCFQIDEKYFREDVLYPSSVSHDNSRDKPTHNLLMCHVVKCVRQEERHS